MAWFFCIFAFVLIFIPSSLKGGLWRRTLRARGIPGHRQADRRLQAACPADPGRHHVDREVGDAVGGAEAA